MRKVVLALFICGCFIFGTLSLPTVSADSNATLSVKIYRILGIDSIEDLWGQGEADWYYHVGISQDNGNTYTWQHSSEPGVNDDDDWISNKMHTFTDISTTTITIAIMLCEDDAWPDGGDDLADISSNAGIAGNWNDLSGSIQPPITNEKRKGTYVGYYNLETNALTGDETTEELDYYKTSGEYDESPADQNDAAVYFSISDNYQAPTASLSVSSTSVEAGELVNFDGGQSTASTGSIIDRYQWDFDGDGVWDAEGQTTSFTYNTAGTYTVQLKVTDSLDETDTTTAYINVGSKVTTAFVYSPSSPSTLDTIQFTDTSSVIGGTLASWYWSFGDGTTSTERNPTHKYSQGKTYTVKLTATADDGATGSETQYITVIELATITGTIKDENGNPISDATIKLYDVGKTTVLETATTNTNGVYTMSEISTGTYDIEALKSSYDNNKKTSKTIYSGDNTVDFVLTASSNGGGTPGFEAVFMFLAIAIVSIILSKRIWRRK